MRRLIVIIIILLVGIVPFVHAQETVFELPAIADGDLIEASFEDDITTYLYAFYGSEGDTVSISMIQDTNDLDPFLVLFDSNGAVLDYDDDSGSINFAAAINNVRLEDDGVYFVMATSVLFVDGIETNTNVELAYTLSISGQTTPDSVEDADVVSLDVEPLSIGDSIRGESTTDDPLALFYLDANAGDDATISLEDADFFTFLLVFAPDGSRIAADASLTQLELEDDGIYIIIATEPYFYEAIDANSSFEGGVFTLVIE